MQILEENVFNFFLFRLISTLGYWALPRTLTLVYWVMQNLPRLRYQKAWRPRPAWLPLNQGNFYDVKTVYKAIVELRKERAGKTEYKTYNLVSLC